jgi:hypothetical protein
MRKKLMIKELIMVIPTSVVNNFLFRSISIFFSPSSYPYRVTLRHVNTCQEAFWQSQYLKIFRQNVALEDCQRQRENHTSSEEKSKKKIKTKKDSTLKKNLSR